MIGSRRWKEARLAAAERSWGPRAVTVDDGPARSPRQIEHFVTSEGLDTPATATSKDGRWDRDNSIVEVRGQMGESALLEENLSVARTITARIGSSTLYITDEVRNDGSRWPSFGGVIPSTSAGPGSIRMSPHGRGTSPKLSLSAQDEAVQRVVRTDEFHPRDRAAAILVIVFGQQIEDVANVT